MSRHLCIPSYHLNLAAWLARHEPEVCRWQSGLVPDDSQADELRQALLKHAYRLEPHAHPEVHEALAAAREVLGVDDPVTVYQAEDGAMGARILVLPSQAHVVLSGPVLDRLDGAELRAMMGHELTHLWLHRQQAMPNDDRTAGERPPVPLIVGHLDALLGEAADGGDAAWQETARRLALHTELLADRGAALAAGGWEAAVRTLVKVSTGMAHVDAASYLQQAMELASMESANTGQSTHPETFLRAQALALWWDGDPSLPSWLVERIHGPLCLDRLDVLDQQRLCHFSGGLMRLFLSAPNLEAAPDTAEPADPGLTGTHGRSAETDGPPGGGACLPAHGCASMEMPPDPTDIPGERPGERLAERPAESPTESPGERQGALPAARRLARDALRRLRTGVAWHQQEAVQQQVRRLFPSFNGRPESLPHEPWPVEAGEGGACPADTRGGFAMADTGRLGTGREPGPPALVLPLAPSLQRYVNALLLDLALADPSLREEGLARAGQLAARLQTLDELLKVLPRDVGLDRKAVTAFKRAHGGTAARTRRSA